MTSYDTTYNRDLARSQRLYDYANIKNDTIQYNMGPTHQGGGMSGGMSGDGFFDDFLSGINKVGESIGNIAPHIATGLDLYDKVKGRKGKGMSGGSSVGRPFSDVAKGMGYSGGVRRGAEMADIASPSGQFSVVAGRTKPNGSGMSGGKRPKLVKGSAEAKAYGKYPQQAWKRNERRRSGCLWYARVAWSHYTGIRRTRWNGWLPFWIQGQ